MLDAIKSFFGSSMTPPAGEKELGDERTYAWPRAPSSSSSPTRTTSSRREKGGT